MHTEPKNSLDHVNKKHVFSTFTGEEYPKKILVVEDDTAMETILKRLVSRASPESQTDWVPSGPEALRSIRLQEARQHPYDLILADVQLPGSINGYDIWEASRYLSPHSPFIFISGTPITRFMERFNGKRDAPPFLAKPLHPDECLSVMREVLEGPRQSV